MEPFVERVYMTEQLESSFGPNVFYEFVYGLISHGQGQPTGDAVLVRVVKGASPAPMATEIHIKDLQSVQERFNDFMERVRRRITPAMAAPPHAAAPSAPSAPLGRYAPDAPRRKSGGLAVSVPMGPKKGSPPPTAPRPGPPDEEPLFGDPTPKAPPKPVPEEPAEFSVDAPFEIVSFVLSTPPNAEAILKVSDASPEKIIIVVRADMAKKVEQHLKNSRDAAPKDFEILTVRRDSRSGPVGSAKRKSALTLDLQRLLGMPKAVLWIPPESKKK